MVDTKKIIDREVEELKKKFDTEEVEYLGFSFGKDSIIDRLRGKGNNSIEVHYRVRRGRNYTISREHKF